MLIIQKFGGSSLADNKCIQNVARIIEETYKKGQQTVVVLSAQGDTTDDLIKKALGLTGNPDKRELDRLLSTGEQVSVALMAIKLTSLGLPVISLGALQAGIHTTADYGNAKILHVETARIVMELNLGKIVLVAGFQGVNVYGDITTLGRGGSDTTAVALAVALDADVCDIYTDVDGIYAADPRLIKTAKRLCEVGYPDMLAMSVQANKVLHNRAVELGMEYGVNLRVRSSFLDGAGTRLVPAANFVPKKYEEGNCMEKSSVAGVSVDKNVYLINLMLTENAKPYEVLRQMAELNINLDIISQIKHCDRTLQLSFTIGKQDGARGIDALNSMKSKYGINNITSDNGLSKISIMGAGMAAEPGIAARFMEIIHECGGEIQVVATSEATVSVLIQAELGEKIAYETVKCFGLAKCVDN
ncbi:MAG: aspartate kinase [Defluviitaleaceae bacterium]|nr:aspartate kinase [Defluviitaleaceae bacterium]